MGINLGVLPFRSDQDKFSVGAERNGKLMDTLPIAHCPVGINLSVLPFRSDQEKFSVGAERNGKLMDTLPIAHSLWA